jgi:ABC-2 type transport system ATP-binding protein
MNIDELNQNRRKRLLVQTRDNCHAQTILENAGHKTRRLANGTLELTGAHAVMSPDVIAALLVNNGTPPTQLLVEEEELERYFLRLVGIEPIAENGLAQSEREERAISAIVKETEVSHAQSI